MLILWKINYKYNMTKLVVQLYDYLGKHRSMCFLGLTMTTLLLFFQVMQLGYKEDISDFLPLDKNNQNALKVYQDISGANRLFAIIQYKDSTKTDPDILTEAINFLADNIQRNDSKHFISDLITQVDMETMTEVSDFLYGNMPYFLTEKDYQHLDSILLDSAFIGNQLSLDKQMLMFPSGGLLASNIQRDPLNLFTPTIAQLQNKTVGINYEMYEGYIFSPDMKKAIVMMSSPFGASETEKNTELLQMLNKSKQETIGNYPEIDIHIIGGPSIAVGNATQIKTDSIISVSISVILILILLFYCFRSYRNLLLIVLSIGWGWLFAMAGLALVHDSISVIVVGISSVILGIAVNYPLHLIAHLSHTPNIRVALKEIIMPLVVGNITTVGAFLSLVPLESVALRDLGLFCSFLLIGTIVFVMIFLPHLVKISTSIKEVSILGNFSNVSLEKKPWVIIVVSILTIIFGYFSTKTSFDSNMSHINYMTDEQKADMNYFQNLVTQDVNSKTIYLVSSDTLLDKALDKHMALEKQLNTLKGKNEINGYNGCYQFLPSKEEQKLRLQRWNEFINQHRDYLASSIKIESQKNGFSLDSFDDFFTILDNTYEVKDNEYFGLLRKSLFSSNISIDSLHQEYNAIYSIAVNKDKVKTIEEVLNSSFADGNYCFDVEGMNSAIATNLSNDFNYIGWACGLIVFFFLWFSFGSIELAMSSFLPMAISWLWILGIMAIYNVQFNIVNVILATFIFGQGDDYTIFITEGSCYEYAYRKKMLASYKNSIIISALIMFIGIGTLIIARHPALHSLAEVTIIGMFSVVLMAYLFPPLIFNWLVMKGVKYRVRPLSLKNLLAFGISLIGFFIELLTAYVLGFLLLVLTKATPSKTIFFQQYVHSLFAFNLKHLPLVKTSIINNSYEDFKKPSLVVCNHQSMLDSMIFMALSPKLILVANENASMNWVIKYIFKWLDYVTLTENAIENVKILESLVEQGYSIVIFPEGKRNEESSIQRFHKGAMYLAEQMKLDVVPVFIHGVNHILPRNSYCLYSGSITIDIKERIPFTEQIGNTGYVQRTKSMHKFYINEYSAIKEKIENTKYFHQLILDRYKYKGVELYSFVKGNLKKYNDYSKWIDAEQNTNEILILNNTYGEFALMMALVHPSIKITVFNEDINNRLLTLYSAEGLVKNLHVVDAVPDYVYESSRCLVFTFNANDAERIAKSNVVLID